LFGSGPLRGSDQDQAGGGFVRRVSAVGRAITRGLTLAIEINAGGRRRAHAELVQRDDRSSPPGIVAARDCG
jgi:hypothetical protein